MWSALIGCPGRTRCGMRSESCRLCKPPRSLSLLIDLPRRRDSDGEPRLWRARRQGCCDAFLGGHAIDPGRGRACHRGRGCAERGRLPRRGHWRRRCWHIARRGHDAWWGVSEALRPSDVITVLAPRGLCPPRPPRHDCHIFSKRKLLYDGEDVSPTCFYHLLPNLKG